MAASPPAVEGVRLQGPAPSDQAAELLDAEAQTFVAHLVRTFRARVDELLVARRERQARLDQGGRLDFLPETKAIREGDWNVAPIAPALADRRVEITGPVDRKMIINALNSGAKVFMADFEDANSPTLQNALEGQVNLRDAVAGTIRLESKGKVYELGPNPATLVVRPRGWHLFEKHLEVDGQPAPAGLVDFGLYFFHNARPLLDAGKGPFFYLPKMESHLEARLWNDVFVAAQNALGIPQGSIRATVLIETLPAAFEMEEILYELREHSAGLNCGRWDYIFSFIKTHRADPSKVLPDRSVVGMTQPFMRAYSLLAIKTCHRRGAHAMGGMAAYIPVKGDEAANAEAFAKVREDKHREASDGHDGTWVAHPALVPVAKEVFDEVLGDRPNQVGRQRDDVQVTADELLAAPDGPKTDQALRHNIRVGIQYIEAWLGGRGAVPLYNLMEDAATAEISRTQIWQWLRHGVTTDDGQPVTVDRVRKAIDEELDVIRQEVGDDRFQSGHFDKARTLFEDVATNDALVDFLTLPAYERLLSMEQAG